MTVAPAYTTMRFIRGTTFTSDPAILKNPDGTPQDLTGYTGELVIWRDEDDTKTPLFTLTTADGSLTIIAAEGRIEGKVPYTDTSVAVDIDGETWPFRLTLTNTNPNPAEVERVVQGWVVAQR